MSFEPDPRFTYKQAVSDFVSQPISATTRLCALYGHPVKHSASPAMQNTGLAALGLDWRYLAFDVAPPSLHIAIAGAKAMKFVGLNLTVPHKVAALEMVDVQDETAKTWGAINTIRFEAQTPDGGWAPLAELPADEVKEIRSQGFNTDADALVRSLQEDLGVRLAGARVLLLGAGGAGQVAALKLAAEGVSELFVVNRTSAKAQEIADDIRRRYPRANVTVGYPKEPVDLLLNGTSLGLKSSDPSPLDENQFPLRKTGAVYDMIYRPAETPLLKGAKAAGGRTSNGLGMLLYQGAKALELWAGKSAPIQVMRTALERNVYGK